MCVVYIYIIYSYQSQLFQFLFGPDYQTRSEPEPEPKPDQTRSDIVYIIIKYNFFLDFDGHSKMMTIIFDYSSVSQSRHNQFIWWWLV